MPSVGKEAAKSVPKGKQNVLNRISDMDYTQDDPLRISIYGRPGSGKTYFWGTYPAFNPKGKKILCILCSGAGELRTVNTPENRKRVKVVQLLDSTELITITDSLMNECPYDLVVLEHATAYQDMILCEILNVDKLPEQKSWGMATREQYGQCTNQFKERMNRLLQVPCSTIVVAQERDFTSDKETAIDVSVPMVGSALSPSAVNWLNSKSDFICQCYVAPKFDTQVVKIGEGKTATETRISVPTDKNEYRMRLGSSGRFMTRCRVPMGTKIPDSIVDPTYEKLYKLANGG